MSVAPLRRSNYVLIQKKGDDNSNSRFNHDRGWHEFCRAWVSINPIRGREVMSDSTTQGIVTHDLRGDWMDLNGVTTEMRIVFNPAGAYDGVGDVAPDGSRLFDIIAVMNDDDFHSDTMIRCEEKKLGHGS